MNSVEALDFAIERLNRNLRTFERVLNDARVPREETQGHIDEYSACVETLGALRDLIAERSHAE